MKAGNAGTNQEHQSLLNRSIFYNGSYGECQDYDRDDNDGDWPYPWFGHQKQYVHSYFYKKAQHT
jgi:hypothetical protein